MGFSSRTASAWKSGFSHRGVDLIRFFHHYRNMETKEAVTALAALAQEHRLAIFRLLVRQGPHGLQAGEIADELGIPASTLSHHVGALERAALLRSWRRDRRIFYATDLEGTRRLLTFLTEECCQGNPEMCGYETKKDRDDDHHLSQSEVRHVPQCSGDDPEFRRGANDHRVPEDAAEPE
jgi:DNA-binding transcriptional ArsR family regulator